MDEAHRHHGDMDLRDTGKRGPTADTEGVLWSARNRWAIGIFLVGLILSVAVWLTSPPPTLWGLLPIVLYAILVLLGIDVVLATIGALISAVLLTGTGPLPLATLMAT